MANLYRYLVTTTKDDFVILARDANAAKKKVRAKRSYKIEGMKILAVRKWPRVQVK